MTATSTDIVAGRRTLRATAIDSNLDLGLSSDTNFLSRRLGRSVRILELLLSIFLCKRAHLENANYAHPNEHATQEAQAGPESFAERRSIRDGIEELLDERR